MVWPLEDAVVDEDAVGGGPYAFAGDVMLPYGDACC